MKKIPEFIKELTNMPIENDFLTQITEITEENISNEQFGVSELAREVGMSRSNLLRKVKKITNLSVSQFIRNVRLKHAKEMLKETSLTVSEISYKVGFGSPSYFIKCFGDYYGYPPGESGKINLSEGSSTQNVSSPLHKLAAIMFTDIEGYTALMQRDEKKAVEYRNRHREVFKEITEKFNGKILQYFGDGTLSTFNSAIDAVRCGIELQLAFLVQPAIPVRIGIHSGDIIFSEDGIIGDGVNVASRIESLAAAGSVFISEKVFDEVKNQSGIKCISLGIFELKNVDKPLEIFALANPGLVVPERKHVDNQTESEQELEANKTGFEKKSAWMRWIIIIVAVIAGGYLISVSGIFDKIPATSINKKLAKKSIAVLPFINDSNDSTNVYIINGLMESILNNLQKIENLRVISRTSVEKYRDNPEVISKIAKELNVNYFVEGSGQKIGEQILLNIQLIEAQTDKHLWAQQYSKKAQNIFKLQMEVANNITEQIEVIITPEEEQRINKTPTDNLVAYDYFLKGLDLLMQRTPENLKNSVSFFRKALEQDNKFARSYSAIAMAYYFMDEHQAEKEYSDSINFYADKALFYDSNLPQGLIAKALFYMVNDEFELAIPYFEKALEYKPNYDLVFYFLVDLYANHFPNTEKYLEYALKGLQLDLLSAYDSTTASYSYLHISNAFIQSGFVEEAEKYINKSLDYFSENLYSQYTKAYILYARDQNLQQLKEQLLETYSKDSSRLDILQEVGKVHYYLGEYEKSYAYYKKFVEIREKYDLEIYRSENGKIGVVFDRMGLTKEAEKYFEEYKLFAENDPSIYKHYALTFYYSYKGETNKAIEHLKLFSEEENYPYWIVLFTSIDPMAYNIKELPEYRENLKIIEKKFNKYHKRIKASLEEKELL